MKDRMDMIWPRWTRARIVATAFYSVVGFALGGIGAPILALPSIPLFEEPFLMLLVPAGAFLSWFLSADATRNTCRHHVCAPQGVTLGMLLGALGVASIAMTLNARGMVFVAVTCVNGVAWAWGAHVGGQKALRAHLGPRVEGLGKTCASCGYDLSGAPDHAACSECGGMHRYARRPEEGV